MWRPGSSADAATGSDVFSLMCRVLVEFLDARVICEKQIIVFYLCF